MNPNFENSEAAIADEVFIQWINPFVLSNNQAELNLQIQHLDISQQQIIREAFDILSMLQKKEDPIDPSLVNFQLSRLNFMLQNQGRMMAKRPSSKTTLFWSAAAAVIFFALISAGIWLTSFKKQQIETYYSERSEKKLPDGSLIILNSNSRINYDNMINAKKEREVWLKGEAFFNVAKKQGHKKFLVHLNDVDVEVTGTKFNAVSRGEYSSVMLQEGRVVLHPKIGHEIVMYPGDYYEFHEDKIIKKKINEDVALAWLDKKIVFENTTIEDAVNIIRDHYGVDFQFEKDDIKSKTLTGIMPNDNLEELIAAIDATGQIKISFLKEGVYLISYPNSMN